MPSIIHSKKQLDRAVAIEENLTNKLDDLKKQNKNITDVFIVATSDNHYTFIEKKSLKGRIYAFFIFLRRFFTQNDNDSFNVKRSMEDLNYLLNNLHQEIFKADLPKEELDHYYDTYKKLDNLINEFHKLQTHLTLKKQEFSIQPFPPTYFPSLPKFFEKEKEERENLKNDFSYVCKNALNKDFSDILINFYYTSPSCQQHLLDFRNTGNIEFVKLTCLDPYLLEKELPLIQELQTHLESDEIALNPSNQPINDLSFEAFKSNFLLIFGDSFADIEKLTTSLFSVSTFSSFLSRNVSDKNLALKSYLDHFVDLHCSSSLMEEIETSLKLFGKCLLQGGWYKHRIYYEIIKQNNDLFSFRIYETGGDFLHQQQALVGNKLKLLGMTEVIDIPESQLFNNSFLQSLRILVTKDKTPLKNGVLYPEEILHQQILPMLHPGKINKIENSDFYKTPQRSGTCSYRSFLAFLAKTVDNYDILKYEFKLDFLKTHLKSLETANLDSLENFYYSLSTGIDKFAASTNKLALNTRQELAYQQVLTPYKNLLKNIIKSVETTKKTTSLKLDQENINVTPFITTQKLPSAFRSNKTSLSNERAKLSLTYQKQHEIYLILQKLSSESLESNPKIYMSLLDSIMDIKDPYPALLELQKKIGGFTGWSIILEAYAKEDKTFTKIKLIKKLGLFAKKLDYICFYQSPYTTDSRNTPEKLLKIHQYLALKFSLLASMEHLYNAIDTASNLLLNQTVFKEHDLELFKLEDSFLINELAEIKKYIENKNNYFQSVSFKYNKETAVYLPVLSSWYSQAENIPLRKALSTLVKLNNLKFEKNFQDLYWDRYDQLQLQRSSYIERETFFQLYNIRLEKEKNEEQLVKAKNTLSVEEAEKITKEAYTKIKTNKKQHTNLLEEKTKLIQSLDSDIEIDLTSINQQIEQAKAELLASYLLLEVAKKDLGVARAYADNAKEYVADTFKESNINDKVWLEPPNYGKPHKLPARNIYHPNFKNTLNLTDIDYSLSKLGPTVKQSLALQTKDKKNDYLYWPTNFDSEYLNDNNLSYIFTSETFPGCFTVKDRIKEAINLLAIDFFPVTKQVKKEYLEILENYSKEYEESKKLLFFQKNSPFFLPII